MINFFWGGDSLRGGGGILSFRHFERVPFDWLIIGGKEIHNILRGNDGETCGR